VSQPVLEQPRDVLVVERVVRHPAVAPRLHDARSPQQPELVRDRRQRHAEQVHRPRDRRHQRVLDRALPALPCDDEADVIEHGREIFERRLVLAYTGVPRNSGTNNWEIIKRHIDGDRGIFDCFDGKFHSAQLLPQIIV